MSLFSWKRNPYRPTSGRQRLVIVLLAIVTAAVVAFGVLDPQARWERAHRLPADAPRCAQGVQTGCVGGILALQVVAPNAASAVAAGPTLPRKAP